MLSKRMLKLPNVTQAEARHVYLWLETTHYNRNQLYQGYILCGKVTPQTRRWPTTAPLGLSTRRGTIFKKRCLQQHVETCIALHRRHWNSPDHTNFQIFCMCIHSLRVDTRTYTKRSLGGTWVFYQTRQTVLPIFASQRIKDPITAITWALPTTVA